MNDFTDDNAWQREVRDRVLAPGFYGSYALNGRFVFMDKGRFATILQKRFAVDTIVQGRKGEAIAIEEKIVRFPRHGNPHTAFFLETESCTVEGHHSPGWMTYAEADYLLYCFHQPDDSLDSWLIDFQKLQDWFWPNDSRFPRSVMSTKNRTAGRVVPIAEVRANVPCWHRIIRAPEAERSAA